MEYPTRIEIGHELLILIYENGGIHYEMKSCDTYEPLAMKFELSEPARRRIRDEQYGDRSSGSLWHNKVQWARDQLAADGHLYRKPRGVWRLTEKGAIRARWLLACRKRIAEQVRLAMDQFRKDVAKRRALTLSVD